jgi:hypothetical protein
MHSWTSPDGEPLRLVEQKQQDDDDEAKALSCYGVLLDEGEGHETHEMLLPGEGVRILSCLLPSKSPWLNPIEPKWLHGKRAIVEPNGTLTIAEVRSRVCKHYDCDQLPLITKSTGSG